MGTSLSLMTSNTQIAAITDAPGVQALVAPADHAAQRDLAAGR